MENHHIEQWYDLKSNIDLIDGAFKTTIVKLTYEKQIKIMKKHLIIETNINIALQVQSFK